MDVTVNLGTNSFLSVLVLLQVLGRVRFLSRVIIRSVICLVLHVTP